MAVQANHTVDVEAHVARIGEDGYTIVRGAIEPDLTVELRDTVRRVFTELDVQPKGNRAEGFATLRIYNLLPKGSDALPAPEKPEETTEIVKPEKAEKADKPAKAESTKADSAKK